MPKEKNGLLFSGLRHGGKIYELEKGKSAFVDDNEKVINSKATKKFEKILKKLNNG